MSKIATYSRAPDAHRFNRLIPRLGKGRNRTSSTAPPASVARNLARERRLTQTRANRGKA